MEDEHCYSKKEAKPPAEMIYADDADFIDTDKERDKHLNEVVPDVLGENNFKVNTNKTENTVIKRGDRIEESWRNVKKLGSLLGDSEDLIRRKQLASATFNSLNKLWLSKKRVNINRKIQLYN